MQGGRGGVQGPGPGAGRDPGRPKANTSDRCAGPWDDCGEVFIFSGFTGCTTPVSIQRAWV